MSGYRTRNRYMYICISHYAIQHATITSKELLSELTVYYKVKKYRDKSKCLKF